MMRLSRRCASRRAGVLRRVAARAAARSAAPRMARAYSQAPSDDIDPLQQAVNDMRAELQKLGYAKDGNVLRMSPAKLQELRAANPVLDQAARRVSEAVDAAEAAYKPSKDELLKPIRVTVTGAAGAIGYSLVTRVLSGTMLGPSQPIDLRLLEVPAAEKALKGVVMELEDCAFPLAHSITATTDPDVAFEGTEYALLVGAKPRGPGMERADLLAANAEIFKVQGQSLNRVANKQNLRAVVVGNPANTNAWVASHFAPDISPTSFSALTRLDHNRGLGALAAKTGHSVMDIERFAIWGNHSKTQYPDVSHTQIGGRWAKEVINDDAWITKTFIPQVQDRGAAIIAARGASSAMSAASATIDHMRDWTYGTGGAWTSMAVWSDGSYGAEPGVYFSYPVVCQGGNYTVVQNAPIDKASAAAMQKSNAELVAERDEVAKLLGIKKATIQERVAEWKARYEKDGVLPFMDAPRI